MPETLRLIGLASPFSMARVQHALPAGLSLAQMFALVQPDAALRQAASLFIGHERIAPAHCPAVRPTPRTPVTMPSAVTAMLPESLRARACPSGVPRASRSRSRKSSESRWRLFGASVSS